MPREFFSRVRPGQPVTASQINKLFDVANQSSRLVGAPGADVLNSSSGAAVSNPYDPPFTAIILGDDGTPTGDTSGPAYAWIEAVPTEAGTYLPVPGGRQGFVGTVATATIVAGVITAVTPDQASPGYTSTPTVTIIGDGTGAVVTATVTAGVVTSFTVSNGGTGYTFAQVIVTGGGVGGGRAYENNLALGILPGTVVLMTVGQYANGDTDYRFVSSLQKLPPQAFFVNLLSAIQATNNSLTASVNVLPAYIAPGPTDIFFNFLIFSFTYGTIAAGLRTVSITGADASQIETVGLQVGAVVLIVDTGNGSLLSAYNSEMFEIIGTDVTARGTTTLSGSVVNGGTITQAGSGYLPSSGVIGWTTKPGDGGGSGAAGTATISGGTITTPITVTTPGSGYSGAPDMIFPVSPAHATTFTAYFWGSYSAGATLLPGGVWAYPMTAGGGWGAAPSAVTNPTYYIGLWNGYIGGHYDTEIAGDVGWAVAPIIQILVDRLNNSV